MGSRKGVVIGSGAGGLAAAAYLAKAGFEVTVCERARHLGGNLASFCIRGYSFDPGLHYVGECEEGRLVHDVLKGIGLHATTLFRELDPEGFDVYRFPDFEVRMRRGLDAYRDQLRRLFPADAFGLLEVFLLARGLRDLQSLATPHGHFSLATALTAAHLVRWGRATLAELLEHYLDDPQARAVLGAPCGDYGLPPSRASGLVGLNVLAHYSGGAYYPRGGAGALRDALVRAGEASGATYRTEAEVGRILVDDERRACGVELFGGERLEADVVLSDADPTVTFGRLLDPSVVPARLARKVERTEPSLGACVLYLGLRRDLRHHGMSAANVWSYGTPSVEEAWEPLFRGELAPEPMLFLSSSSLKDDEAGLAPTGCTALEVLTFLPESLFATWASKPAGERGPEYAALKERVTTSMLDALDRRMPGLVGDVEVRELATPLTWADTLAAPHGGAYGPALTPRQVGPWRFGAKTPIEGLYLVGQGTLGNGVAPSLLSGKIAATIATGSELR